MKHLLVLGLLVGSAQAAPELWRVELSSPARDLAVVGGELHVVLESGALMAVKIYYPELEHHPVHAVGAKPVAGAPKGVRAVSGGDAAPWIADAGTVSRGSVRVKLPGAKDLVAGYEDTAFVAAEAVYRVAGGVAQRLGAKPAQPTALQLFGGRVLVGSAAGLHWMKLSDGSATPLGSVGPVEGIAMDHVGYFVVSTGGGLLRVTPEGVATPLPVKAVGSVAFAARRLYTLSVDRRAVVAHDYLALLGEDPRVHAARDARLMKPFTEAGLGLTGGETGPTAGPRRRSIPRTCSGASTRRRAWSSRGTRRGPRPPRRRWPAPRSPTRRCGPS